LKVTGVDGVAVGGVDGGAVHRERAERRGIEQGDLRQARRRRLAAAGQETLGDAVDQDGGGQHHRPQGAVGPQQRQEGGHRDGGGPAATEHEDELQHEGSGQEPVAEARAHRQEQRRKGRRKEQKQGIAPTIADQPAAPQQPQGEDSDQRADQPVADGQEPRRCGERQVKQVEGVLDRSVDQRGRRHREAAEMEKVERMLEVDRDLVAHRVVPRHVDGKQREGEARQQEAPGPAAFLRGFGGSAGEHQHARRLEEHQHRQHEHRRHDILQRPDEVDVVRQCVGVVPEFGNHRKRVARSAARSPGFKTRTPRNFPRFEVGRFRL
jgi:hypothetical protein